MTSHHSGGDPPPYKRKMLSVSDYARSLLIALRVKATWGHCYENAYPTFFAYPSLFYPHGVFVEGWIVFEDADRVILMEHGWCMSGEHIIDPTIVLAVELGQPVFYFSGVLRTHAELEALENELFPHVRFSGYGEDGMEHPDYRAAYEAAQQHAHSLLTPSKVFIRVVATEVSPQ